MEIIKNKWFWIAIAVIIIILLYNKNNPLSGMLGMDNFGKVKHSDTAVKPKAEIKNKAVVKA